MRLQGIFNNSTVAAAPPIPAPAAPFPPKSHRPAFFASLCRPPTTITTKHSLPPPGLISHQPDPTDLFLYSGLTSPTHLLHVLQLFTTLSSPSVNGRRRPVGGCRLLRVGIVPRSTGTQPRASANLSQQTHQTTDDIFEYRSLGRHRRDLDSHQIRINFAFDLLIFCVVSIF